MNSEGSPASRLRQDFKKVKNTTYIGGAAVLERLSDLASACIIGTSAAQDAVAFALSELFARHAEDRTERVVTGDDNYLLTGSGDDDIANAIMFIEDDGTSDEAVRIIAALARLTPNRLYGRWPPKIHPKR